MSLGTLKSSPQSPRLTAPGLTVCDLVACFLAITLVKDGRCRQEMAQEEVQAMEISVCKWSGYHSRCITSCSGCSRARQSNCCPRACLAILTAIFNYHGYVPQGILHV